MADRPGWWPTDEEWAEAMWHIGPCSTPHQEHNALIRLTQRKLVDELEEIWETRCKGNRESFGSFVLSLVQQLKQEVGYGTD